MKKQNAALLSLWVILMLLCQAYGESFKIAVLPDTQGYSADYPDIFSQQTQWIVTNRDGEAIKFVTHLGDVINNPAIPGQWTAADSAMDEIDGELPYSVCIGNHDYNTVNDKNEPNSATFFKTHFGASRYSGYTWYGGSHPRGLSHYQIFTADGRQWLHLNLEWEPDLSVLKWAQDIIDAHNNLPVIMSTHSLLDANSPDNPYGFYNAVSGTASNGGWGMWFKFIYNNDQIFLVLNGHFGSGEATQTLQNAYGHNVFFILTDYQYRANGGDGWMRLLEFSSSTNEIKATTYSPKLDQAETDANSMFTLNMNFNTRLSNFAVREQTAGIQAANIGVIEHNIDNTADSVTLYIPQGQKTADINIIEPGAYSWNNSNGDYWVRVGNICEGDVMGGILVSSVAENGRLDTSGVAYENYHTSSADYSTRGQLLVGVSATSREIDVEGTPVIAGGRNESDANVAIAYFPFSEGFIGAHCDVLYEGHDETLGRSSKVFSVAGNGVVWGENFTQYPSSLEDPCLVVQMPMPLTGDPRWKSDDRDRGVFEFTLPDVNSMTDGVVLMNSAANKNTYGVVSPHPDGSGWQFAVLYNDNNPAGGNTSCSAFGFVYVPYSTPGIVAGRVKGNGVISSGTGGFKIEPVSTGINRLRIYGCTPADGALLLTGESHWYNNDNIHTYEPDYADNCWIIESRDLEGATLTDVPQESFVFVFVPFDGHAAPFDGNGTPADPFKIYNKQDLENIDYWPASHFKLMNNINLNGTVYDKAVIAYDTNSLYNVYGGTPFTGSLDGNGYAIQNLAINAVGKEFVGLFGKIGNGGAVSNLTLANVNISGDSNSVGALAGQIYYSGTISNCSVGGNVSGKMDVGGLVGQGSGTLISCSSAANAAAAQRVGSLAGYLWAGSSINICHATGNASCTVEVAGGLIGYTNTMDVNDCYASGNVSGVSRIGGFVGNCNLTDFNDCYSSGVVTSTGWAVGGFVGRYSESTSVNCYSTCAVTNTRSGQADAGGFIGSGAKSVVTKCYATGNVTANYGYTGGFIGRNETNGNISKCYATGKVKISQTRLGGFVGSHETSSVIDQCYASGNVEGKWWVGGFVGNISAATISNCYAVGSVQGESSVAGFVGTNWGASIYTNNYAVGLVTASTTSYIGGFMGQRGSGSAETTTACFWDKETSNQPTTQGSAVGKTTVQMKSQATFTGWNFTTPVWKIRESLSYPKLNWQVFSNGDIDYSGSVGLLDLDIIADDWLKTGTGLAGDIHPDNKVNFLDFADFALDWSNQ